jgi:hypothetical protein
MVPEPPQTSDKQGSHLESELDQLKRQLDFYKAEERIILSNMSI